MKTGSKEASLQFAMRMQREELLELLTDALPYVEEGEQFNKPTCRDLSKKIRAAIAKTEVKA